jgi:SAM-dependent methyltransferase
MMPIPGLEWTFNTVAEEYDKWRPTYVPELYKDIFTYKPINLLSNVLEIGIGTGQATLPILETGCNLTAVELGENLAEITRRKFSSYNNISIETGAFQNYESNNDFYDLIYSASAFHWIPEEVGYSKVYKILKSGGVFVRFADHPYYNKNGQEALCDEIEKVYAEYMPALKPSPTPKPSSEYTEVNAINRANIALKYGFVDISHKLYYRTITYSSDDFINRIAIQSDKIALKKSERYKLCIAIKDAIDRHGGTITSYETIDLNIARKP